MPLFEFWCESCAAKFTVLEPAPPATAPCPTCKAASERRMVSSFRQGRDEDAQLGSIADRLDALDDAPQDQEMRSVMRDIGSVLGDADAAEEVYEEG